jgi:uncharacterized membrane protein YebE (DUF533 family)
VIDPKQLLEQVLGSARGADARNAGRDFMERLDTTRGSHAFAGGAVAGVLLSLLMGGGRRRRGGGGLLGAAALGALALQAYQSYQRQQAGGFPRQAGSMPRLDAATAEALPHARPAADGSAFELVLVRAMVGAAKADGHIDAAEQRRLFAEVERLGLDADAKAYVFELLTHDVDLDRIARAAATPEQGAELYLAARLAIDPDVPAENAYLDDLAARLKLPADLRATLDSVPLPSKP